MALVLNEEQVMLKESAAGFLAEKATVAHLRRLRDGASAQGFDGDVAEDHDEQKAHQDQDLVA